eukprot:3466563-Alexandrium_andersonii.AAC.1
MEELIRDPVGARRRPAGSENGLPNTNTANAQLLQGLGRPATVVSKRCFRGFAGSPADRPDLSATIPQSFKCFAAVG